MGTGIAAVFAAAKVKVTLIDTDQRRLDESRGRIRGIAAELLSAELIDENPETVAARVVCTPELEACKESELILEAIYENLEAKHALYIVLEANRLYLHDHRQQHIGSASFRALPALPPS